MTDTSSDHRGGKISRAIRYVRTEPGLLRNVIAIGVVVILGLGIGGTVLSQQRFTPPWQQTRYVWATFSEAASVAPGLGQNVQINGVQVGQIQEAQIDNRGRALILMTIREADYDKPIYNNATVVMRPTTPLNTMYIELNPGSPPAPEMPDYGVLPLQASTSPIEIDQPLSQLDTNTRNLARELLTQANVALAQAPRDLPRFISSTADFTKQLRPIAEQLDVRRDKVRQLITSLGIIAQTVGNNDVRLTDLANRLQTTLAATASQNDAIRDSFNQLPEVADRLRESTGAVQGLSDQLDPTLDNVREASETLPGSLNGLTNTVDTLDTTLDKLDPVASKLRPTAADLRPFVSDLNRTFPDLKTIVSQLNPVTDRLVPYLPDLTAFTYQIRSVVDRTDAQTRNSARALVTTGPCGLTPGVCNLPDTAGSVPNSFKGEKLGDNNVGDNGNRLYPNTAPQYDTFDPRGKGDDKKDDKKDGGDK